MSSVPFLQFVSNFGDNGASIHFEDGGGLYCKRVHFSMDEKYISFNEDQVKAFKLSEKIFNWTLP